MKTDQKICTCQTKDIRVRKVNKCNKQIFLLAHDINRKRNK